MLFISESKQSSTVKVQPQERKNVVLGCLEQVGETGKSVFWVDFCSKTLPCSTLSVKRSLPPPLNLFTTLTGLVEAISEIATGAPTLKLPP